VDKPDFFGLSLHLSWDDDEERFKSEHHVWAGTIPMMT